MDCITVEVMRRKGESWGLQVSGEGPCYIESIQSDSPSEEAGLEVGDYLISVNGVSVYDSSHENVVQLIADSGRICRLRILPSQNCASFPVTDTKNKSQQQSLNSNQNSTQSQEECSEESDSESENDDYIPFGRKPSKTTQNTSYDLQVRYDKAEELEKHDKRNNKEIHLEQSSFIVTRENQRQFDEHYKHEGNFVGRRATVAGAFTGDFNVIRNKKEEEDVMGVKSRVLAGIQHFSFSEKNERISQEDRGKIILYTTSLGIHRSVAYKCEEARKILKGFRVKYEDRNVYIDPEYKDELYHKLGLSATDKMPVLPRLFIEGISAGGFDEIQEMSDCGDLRIRLQDFPKYNIRMHCTTCSASGIISCTYCKGKGFRQKNRFTTLKCGNCQQKGKINCPDCF